MTFPMAGYAGWFGRMKNVGSDIKPVLEWREQRQRFSSEQIHKYSAIEINGKFQGGKHLSETRKNSFLVNVLS